MAYQENNGGGGFRGGNDGGMQRQMFQGDWKCAKCGAEIKELPFEPDPARLEQLLCRDCHRQKRQSFRRDRY
jgi:CxxC-x17-CxxC domain-containing protein